MRKDNGVLLVHQVGRKGAFYFWMKFDSTFWSWL